VILGQVIKDFRQTKFQRNYMWEFIPPDIDIIPGYEIGKLCQDVRFGDYSMNEVSSMRYGPYRTGYANLLEIPNVTATFLKTSPDIVTEYFYAWREKIVNSEGHYFPKLNYSKTGYLILYSTAGEEVERYKFRGMFPKNIPEHNLSYAEQDIVRLQVAFHIDLIERM
jgi:hypothetical protein